MIPIFDPVLGWAIGLSVCLSNALPMDSADEQNPVLRAYSDFTIAPELLPSAGIFLKKMPACEMPDEASELWDRLI
jgi:hypothetical protein